MDYLNHASTDSFAPGRLYVGEWTDGTYGTQGIYNDYLNVAVEQPRGLKETEEFSTWNGSIMFIEIFPLDEPIDIIEQQEW
jgi:hypothetical protein